MDLDLINYMTHSDKMQMAKNLLRSAKVYNECLYLMTGKKRKSADVEALANKEKMQERYDYDNNRDYAQVLHEPYDEARMRNYHELMRHEIEKMHCLLQDKNVRMIVIKDIMQEEGLNLKNDFQVCNLNMASRLEKNKSAKLGKIVYASFYHMLSKLNGNAH